jgi:hypothetical protein
MFADVSMVETADVLYVCTEGQLNIILSLPTLLNVLTIVYKDSYIYISIYVLDGYI